jgi:tetratricopeptide (TPR) repeat protein
MASGLRPGGGGLAGRGSIGTGRGLSNGIAYGNRSAAYGRFGGANRLTQTNFNINRNGFGGLGGAQRNLAFNNFGGIGNRGFGYGRGYGGFGYGGWGYPGLGFRGNGGLGGFGRGFGRWGWGGRGFNRWGFPGLGFGAGLGLGLGLGWGWGGLGWGGLGWGGLGWGLGWPWGLGYGGWGGWGYPGFGFGGYGSGLYDWGYSPYYNPYVVIVQQPTVYDYSQPISTTAPPPSQAISDQAGASFDRARDAFKLGNYSLALDLADQALRLLPNDISLHEFRALTLFALQRYDEAATALYAVLADGPGWDWPTLIGLYSEVDTYTGQLRALESAIRQNPRSAATRCVLAYHYITAGHLEPAIDQLKDVVQLQPRDTVASQLLRQLQPATQGTLGVVATAPGPGPASTAPNSTVVTPTSSTVKEGSLAGTWTAEPSADTTIRLTVVGGRFTWKVTSQGRSQEIQGDETYGNGILTLARSAQDGQPPMVGRVTWRDEDHFSFKILAGPPDDPGLSFTRLP